MVRVGRNHSILFSASNVFPCVGSLCSVSSAIVFHASNKSHAMPFLCAPCTLNKRDSVIKESVS